MQLRQGDGCTLQSIRKFFHDQLLAMHEERHRLPLDAAVPGQEVALVGMRRKAVDGVGDVVIFQQPFRLQIIEMKPYAARIVALQEIDVLVGLPVAWTAKNGAHSLGSGRIIAARFRPVTRERLLSLGRTGGSEHAPLIAWAGREAMAVTLPALLCRRRTG